MKFTEVQRSILENASKEPIHKGMLRRAVKLDTGINFNSVAFDAQLESLIEEGVMKKHDSNYYSLRDASEAVFRD